MQQKMTAEEIQILRENAEKERQKHAEIMRFITGSIYKGQIPSTLQKEIVQRKRETEIFAMLELFAANKEFLCEEVQLFIYDDENGLAKAKDYMLRNNFLSVCVEKRVFDDKLLLPGSGTKSESINEFYVHFSPNGEKYMVDQTLKSCLQVNRIVLELCFLENYMKIYSLSTVAENALMQFLYESAGRDSTIDRLERVVFNYLSTWGNLALTSEELLIKSSNHKLIMYYIKNSQLGIKNEKALLERGNREEIEAYFNRYAKGEDA